MARLRAGLLAVCVAMLSCLSLVVSSSASAAADGISPVDAFRDFLVKPGNFTDYIVGDLNNNGAYDTQEAGFETSPAWMTAIASKVGGTPAQVDAGTKYVSRACKTGYGCIAGVAAVSIGLAAGFEAVDGGVFKMPWETADAGALLADAPINFYASQVAQSNPCTSDIRVDKMPAKSSLGIPGYGDGFHAYLFTSSRSFTTGFCTVGGLTWAADWRSKRTGETWHTNNEAGYWNGNGTTDWRGPFEHNGQFNPATVSHTWAEIELIRLHWDQTATGTSTSNTAKGFWWGLNPIPGAGQIESLTRCRRPNGTTYERVATENVNSGVVGVPACDPGDVPVYTQTTLINADGSRELQTSQTLDGGTVGNEQFPLCVANGCQLLVKANGVPCQVGMSACVEWSRDKSDKTCWYGPYQMPLRVCYPLERAYEHPQESPVPASSPNIDGNPDTHEGPAPQLQPTPTPSPTGTTTTTTQPSASPAPSGSPSPMPSSGTNPSTDPSTRPTPSPSGSVSGSPAPEPTPGGSGTPNPNDPAGQECFPSGWSVFNPVQWVLMPIRCAFEPDAGNTKQRVDNLRQQFADRGIGPLVAAVVKTVESVPDEGGCQGPAYTFNVRGVHQTLHPFSACDEPMATVAEYGHALATLTLVISGGLAIIRAIGVGFGFQFGMKGGGSGGD